MNHDRRIAGNYAKAIARLAIEGDCFSSLLQQCETLCALLKTIPSLILFFENRIVAREKKHALLKLMLNESNLILWYFMEALLSRHHLRLFPAITRELEALGHQHRGETLVSVTTSVPLDDSALQSLTTFMKTHTSHSVVIQPIIDPRLIGGIRVQWGSMVMDHSIHHRLNTLRKTFSREKH